MNSCGLSFKHFSCVIHFNAEVSIPNNKTPKFFFKVCINSAIVFLYDEVVD